MQRIAITGCASRFAQVLLPLLEADGEIEQVVGIDRVPPATSYSKLIFHQGDIRDAGIKEIVAGCDTVVHLAFIVGRPYSMSLQEAASINLAGTWNVCRLAAEAGVRKLVVSSSVAAYGALPDNSEPLVEDSPLRGLFTDFYYSQHKHANEIWLDGLQLAFPDLIISRLRPSTVMGPHQYAATTMIMPDHTYYTTRQGYRTRVQLIHEDDLAAAFHVMVRHDLPGAYNVVGDGAEAMPTMAAAAGLNVVEIPEEMLVQGARSAWQSGASLFGPEWVTLNDSIICSNEKLRATGLWTPRYSTAEAYATTIAPLL